MVIDLLIDGITAALIILFCLTGEGALFAFSLGRRRPNWMVPWKGETTMSHVLKEPSFYVGLGVWTAVIALIGAIM